MTGVFTQPDPLVLRLFCLGSRRSDQLGRREAIVPEIKADSLGERPNETQAS